MNRNVEEKLSQVEKKKNNFEDYGFRGDFKGEIFKEVKGNGRTGTKRFLGHALNGEGVSYPCIWEEWGECTFCTSSKTTKYQLTPIKKKWYEIEENFPCVVIKETSNVAHIVYAHNKVENTLKTESFSISPYSVRPATNEEIDALKIKQ